jgi:hypothetical protein
LGALPQVRPRSQLDRLAAAILTGPLGFFIAGVADFVCVVPLALREARRSTIRRR